MTAVSAIVHNRLRHAVGSRGITGCPRREPEPAVPSTTALRPNSTPDWNLISAPAWIHQRSDNVGGSSYTPPPGRTGRSIDFTPRGTDARRLFAGPARRLIIARGVDGWLEWGAN